MGVICAAISEACSLANPVSFVLDAPVGEPAHVHQPIGRPNNCNYQYNKMKIYQNIISYIFQFIRPHWSCISITHFFTQIVCVIH